MKLILAFLLSSIAISASADQCAWNDKSTAARARAFLAYYPDSVYTYCEPCGDKVMKEVFYGQDKIKTDDKRAVHFAWQDPAKAPSKGATGWMMTLNGEYKAQGTNRDIDLAYVFIESKKGFINLGARFTCTNNSFWNPENKKDFTGMPEGVSPYIAPNTVPVESDVTEEDFINAYGSKYPNEPKG
jgi:hypothetical protein